MRDNLLYKRFKTLLQEHQVIKQNIAADELGLTKGQLFEYLMAWNGMEDTDYQIFDDLIVTKNFLLEHDFSYKGKTICYDEKDDTISIDTLAKLADSTQKNNIPEIVNKFESPNKTTFIEDKFQNYYEDAMSKFEYADSNPVESKKPITIPKITHKNQIYWVCELCGLKNPYFLSNCKECDYQRPDFLYEKCEPISISNNGKSAKYSISHAITDHWQTVDVIAKKMGIRNTKDLKALKNKLKYLAEVNYVTPNSTGTMFKLNNFEM